MINKADICFTIKTKPIREKEINVQFGNVFEKHKKVVEFMKRNKTDKIIPVKELGKHDAALFQTLLIPHELQEYSLSDIMVDFEIDYETGTVTAKKLFRCLGRYEMETRVYYLDNYGKTWRAWSALPKREAARIWD